MLISAMAIICSVGVTFLIPSADGLEIPTEVGSFLPGSSGSQSDTVSDDAGPGNDWSASAAPRLSAYGEEPGVTPTFELIGEGSLSNLTKAPASTQLFTAKSLANPTPRAALLTISSPADPAAQRLFEPTTGTIGLLFGKPTYFLAGFGRDSTTGPTAMKIFYFTGAKWSELGLPPLLRKVEGRIRTTSSSHGETGFAGEIGSTIDPRLFGLKLVSGSTGEAHLASIIQKNEPGSPYNADLANALYGDAGATIPDPKVLFGGTQESTASADNGVKATFRPSFNPAKSVGDPSTVLELKTELTPPSTDIDQTLIRHFTAGNNEQGFVVGVWPTHTKVRSIDLRTGESIDLPVAGLPLARSEKSYAATSFARNSKAAVAVVKGHVRLSTGNRVQSVELNRLVRVDLEGAPEIRTLPSSAGEVFSVDATAERFMVWTDLGAFVTDDLIHWRNFEFDQPTDTTYVGNESTGVLRLPKDPTGQGVVVSLPDGYSEKLPLPDQPAGIVSLCSNARFVFSLDASGVHRAEFGKGAASEHPQRWELVPLPTGGIPHPDDVSWERCTADENYVFLFGAAADKTDDHEVVVVSKMEVSGQAFGLAQLNPCGSRTANEVLMDATSDGKNSYITIARHSSVDPGDVSVVQLTGSKAFEISEISSFSGSGLEVPMALEVHGSRIEVAGEAADSAVVWSADRQTDGLPCRDLL